MFTFVIGASASGKSEYAEKLAMSLDGQRIYLAAMEPFGQEAQARIARHRAARAGRGFVTLERYTDLAHLEIPEESVVLLEDVGNLAANELFREDGGGAEAVLEGVLSVARRCRHLIAVTNEVFLGGQAYEGDTLRYLKTLAKVNRELAKRADRVAEVVCGIPNSLKEAGQ